MAPKRVAPKPVAKKTAAARTAGGPSYFSTANRQARERAEQQRGVLAQVQRLPADRPWRRQTVRALLTRLHSPSTPQVRAKLAQRKLETQAKKDAAARVAAQKRGKTFQI